MTSSLEAYSFYSLGLDRTRALRLQEAISFFEKALKLDPDFAMARARIGYVHSVAWAMPEKGKPFLEKAYQLSNRLTQRDRLFLRAWYAMASRDYRQAEQVYQEILRLFPTELEVYLSLSNLMTGDRPAEAGKILERGLEVDPRMPDLYNMMAGVQRELGHTGKALENAKLYVELTAGEPNAYDTLGMIYQWVGSYDEARAAYQRALEKKPDFEIAIIHRANLDFQLGRYRDALAGYREYLRIAPSELERYRGHTSLSWVYWKKGDLGLAAAEMDQAIGADHIGTFLQRAAETGAAVPADELRRSVSSLAPYTSRGAKANLRMRLFQAGVISLNSHRLEEGLSYMRAASLEGHIPYSIDPLETCLADALLAAGRNDEAVAEYEKPLRINPNYPMALYGKGLALERKGDLAESRRIMERFLRVWKDADADVPELVAARNIAGK